MFAESVSMRWFWKSTENALAIGGGKGADLEKALAGEASTTTDQLMSWIEALYSATFHIYKKNPNNCSPVTSSSWNEY